MGWESVGFGNLRPGARDMTRPLSLPWDGGPVNTATAAAPRSRHSHSLLRHDKHLFPTLTPECITSSSSWERRKKRDRAYAILLRLQKGKRESSGTEPAIYSRQQRCVSDDELMIFFNLKTCTYTPACTRDSAGQVEYSESRL